MIWLALAAVAGLIWTVALYNRMVALRRLTENAWSDVDVYLKRRAELVPNLVAAVKAAAAYESATLERLALARANAAALPGPSLERANAETQITQGMSAAMVIVEAQPELRTTDQFLNLQHELSTNERMIANARQYFNACVRDYNTMIESFPQSVIAGPSGFTAKEFFEIEEYLEREAPQLGDLR